MKYKKQFKFKKLESNTNGIVEGYASIFDMVDSTNDIILKGAFKKTLDEYRESNERIPMLYSHENQRLIGGFDAKEMYEDENGLYVKGVIDLNVQEGKELYSLAKKDFLNSFSIGFGSDNFEKNEHGGYTFKELTLYEISLVVFPANKKAKIRKVKSAMSPKMYGFMDDDTTWDGDKSKSQIRIHTNSESEPSRTYKNGFLWFDSSEADNFTSYKLPFVYVVDGEFKIVPKGLSAAVAAINGARGGVDIPESDISKVKSTINTYYKRIGKEPPFGNKSNKVIDEFKTQIELLRVYSDLKYMLYKINRRKK